jgi:oxygen-independent coproporphyrinogen-3 oxidase
MQADMYDEVYAILKNNGYDRYEVSNFAKKGFESRHNGKYWRGVVYYGFGVSAHSLFDGFIRSENTSNVDEYINGITTVESHVLSREERKEEAIMLSLRTSEGLNIKNFNQEFGCNLEQDKKREIDKLKRSGVISIECDHLKATDKGFYVLDGIIMELI